MLRSHGMTTAIFIADYSRKKDDMSVFTGAGVAIITPMTETGAINYDKLGEIIDYQIENGTDSIIICVMEAATLFIIRGRF